MTAIKSLILRLDSDLSRKSVWTKISRFRVREKKKLPNFSPKKSDLNIQGNVRWYHSKFSLYQLWYYTILSLMSVTILIYWSSTKGMKFDSNECQLSKVGNTLCFQLIKRVNASANILLKQIVRLKISNIHYFLDTQYLMYKKGILINIKVCFKTLFCSFPCNSIYVLHTREVLSIFIYV